MVENGLVIARFVHYTALLFIFGSALFPLYALRRIDGQRSARIAIVRTDGPFIAAFTALLSGAAWILFSAAAMTGSLDDAFTRETMAMVAFHTGFGSVWSVHLALVAALAIALGLDRVGWRPHTVLLSLLAGTSLATLAGVGHTQSQDGRDLYIHVGADAAHLLAAGAWLGGLVPLVALLAWRGSAHAWPDTDIGYALMRFSGMGYAAVAVLIATGIVNSLYLIDEPLQLPVSLYGRLLVLKLGLFGLMLLLAALNRFWLVPAFERNSGGPESHASKTRLRRHVIGEQVLGLGVIVIVSVIGTLSPNATSISNDHKMSFHSATGGEV